MEREIPLGAGQLWQVLGEQFGDLSWSSGVDSSTLEGALAPGAVRVCRVEPNILTKTGQVREVLLAFDRDARTLSYEARDLPGFMPRAINRWSVDARGPRRCVVRSHASCELAGLARVAVPMIRFMLRRMGERFIDELVEAASRTRACTAAHGRSVA